MSKKPTQKTGIEGVYNIYLGTSSFMVSNNLDIMLHEPKASQSLIIWSS